MMLTFSDNWKPCDGNQNASLGRTSDVLTKKKRNSLMAPREKARTNVKLVANYTNHMISIGCSSLHVQPSESFFYLFHMEHFTAAISVQ